MLERACLCGVGRLWFEAFVSNLEVERKVPGLKIRFLEGTLDVTRLRFLGCYAYVRRTTASFCAAPRNR